MKKVNENYNPKVSIIIPVYNGSNYLADSIDSALSQTYENIEVLVVNDGSSDYGATEKIAKEYGAKISYYSKPNGGVASALNFGIQKMSGEYFSWLSHDDLYEKTKIEDQINETKKHIGKNVIIAANARTLFPTGYKKEQLINKSTFAYFDIFLATSAVIGVNGCSLLIPKKALVDNNGFDESLTVTQDYELWFRLKDTYEFILLEKNLVLSRRHDKQDSVQKKQTCFEAADILHYNFLKNISKKRYEQFFKDNDLNISDYIKNYEVYKASGYIKTSGMMLKHLLDYYLQTNIVRYNELVASEIGEYLSVSTTLSTSSKPKIMFFSYDWRKGGIERVLSAIFNHYASEYNCILVTAYVPDHDNSGYLLPVNVSHFNITNKNQIAELTNLALLLGVNLFIGSSNLSQKQLEIYPLFKMIGIRTIAYNHGHYFLPYTAGDYLYPVALSFKDAYKSADFTIWLTKISCAIYSIDNNNGIYIPNPVKINNKIIPKKNSSNKILAVGRFDDEIKRIDNLLLLFKELHGINSALKLDIVGRCPMDMKLQSQDGLTLREFIHNKQIPIDSIDFHGELVDLSAFYNNAAVLLLTSRNEGFGMVIVEALSHGLPVACYDFLGLDEIIMDGKNGWVCKQGDGKSLAKKIASMLEDDSLYHRMSVRAIDSVAKFSEAEFFKRWDILLDILIKKELKNTKSLRSDKNMPIKDYNKVILEYEKHLNYMTERLLNLDHNRPSTTPPTGRLKNIASRLKISFYQDGPLLTVEKIVRKVQSKLKK